MDEEHLKLLLRRALGMRFILLQPPTPGTPRAAATTAENPHLTPTPW